ncbi:FecCD family ABC transporter permease [Loigolactobacillus bifermentans]|uniref:Iron chelating abc transporter n=1 Tax=Loigolactobacillus bifermentans DSM 20003 TaxID=1423726 RepID=A0A0R1GZL8_9LACO|nr:iron ABC transporter permease [Loigolactobacillus bifermentans]KRK39835.1 iron chelating abc transporter [Loigolactobacillus bifermentans DSM 20003]QGG61493.1 iron chelate uptake ABC transporter family permease subunit [Loigolactobacillus bifermentans]
MSTAEDEPQKSTGISLPWKIILVVLPIAAALASLCFGRYAMPIQDIFHAIHDAIFGGNTVSPQVATVLWSMRMPRILLALLAGAGLSAAGCAFQSLFSNPLATPDTIGVASGASFGAALGLLMNFGLMGVQVVSLIFGLAALILTILAGSNKKRSNLNSVVLAGIMMGSLFSALVSLVKFAADPENQLPAITYWLMGSLDAAGYDSLLLGAPPILVGLAVLLLLRWRLNLLPLSEDEARSTGVNVTVLRGITILCATMITASVVSMCGQVGWVGLLVPHMCRMKFGNNHTALLPASVLAGGAFLVVVDTVARSISASEFPISILTALIGAPFFIYLMRRTGGWQL